MVEPTVIFCLSFKLVADSQKIDWLLKLSASLISSSVLDEKIQFAQLRNCEFSIYMLLLSLT